MIRQIQQDVESDPFMTGDPKIYTQSASARGFAGTDPQQKHGREWTKHLESVAALVITPALCFSVTTIAVAMPPPGWLSDLLAACVWLLCFMLAASCYAVRRQGQIYLFLSALVLPSTLAAPFAGQRIYNRTMNYFWMHKTGVAYESVSPAKAADAYQDANVIGFSAMARVDLHHILGNRPRGGSSTYCVAPIVDAHKPSKEINFWAAGIDCCEPHRGFLCGESLKENAKTGIVLPASTSSYAMHRWEQFRTAAKHAAEFYGFELPSRPIFVRLHEDAAGVQSKALRDGCVEVVLMCFTHLMVMLFLAAYLHWSTSYQRYHAQPPPAFAKF
eukprot:TRINITY_DN42776_c0_g1_i1.p1 TRINITY_DN42776_c0_g1~~TRINITY_DN42776_c0_g1_i1.p1  ORF type:complete len:331 (+),score=51.76 TRINITY_DN42776_c0_g1_i1:92-1084(+)